MRSLYDSSIVETFGDTGFLASGLAFQCRTNPAKTTAAPVAMRIRIFFDWRVVISELITSLLGGIYGADDGNGVLFL